MFWFFYCRSTIRYIEVPEKSANDAQHKKGTNFKTRKKYKVILTFKKLRQTWFTLWGWMWNI